jgi:hypothetical protein
VPRTKFHLAQEDEQTSLVAAGVIQRPEVDPAESAEMTAREVAELRSFQRHAQPILDALTPLALDKIVGRLAVPAESVQVAQDRYAAANIGELTGPALDHFAHAGIELLPDDAWALAAYRIDGLRDFTTKQRKKAASSGSAMPDGSFPIENCDDWMNARRAIGRAPAAKRPAVQAHINKRGKALNCGSGD